jgi:hypothetical protein
MVKLNEKIKIISKINVIKDNSISKNLNITNI